MPNKLSLPFEIALDSLSLGHMESQDLVGSLKILRFESIRGRHPGLFSWKSAFPQIGGGGGPWVQDDSNALHLLCTLFLI